jgi:putative glycerol-1-phosphate prenyltransferase
MLVYKHIIEATAKGKKLFAVLIDPDKFELAHTENFIKKVNVSIASHIFVGGSFVADNATEILVETIKRHTDLPVVLFPGDVSQITENADALLFLSLLSGRNTDYLIGKHIKAVSRLRDTNLEVIPTGYILIESGAKTAVSRVTGTSAMSRTKVQPILDTASAGQFLGMRLIYLEAGSGAKQPVTNAIIKAVKSELQIPLIVGGGLRTKSQIENAYASGADVVVVGTAFEEDEGLFQELKKNKD